MKLTLNIFEKGDAEVQRRRPMSHLFGGRVRTSTVVLIVAFLAVWWVYDTYRPEPPPKPAAPQVVPPGFVPDPNYTWVPRSRVQQPAPTVTVTPTTTTTTPPFGLPTPPCLLPPPFCPPSASPLPASQQPQPGPGPAPTSAPPAS
ncbi:MAG TPA: hypothetical protein VE441_13380 [Mycobacterium sp.]|nr:hypothetical protein [Mycobacterium sp.]